MSRRRSRRARVVFGTVWCFGMAAFTVAAPVGRAADSQRAYTAGLESLQVNGETVFVKDVDGGGGVGTVVEQPDGSGAVTKRIGGTTIEPTRARITPGTLNKFLRAQLSTKSAPASGSILHADYNRKVVGQLEFTNAVLTALELPALDG